MKRLLLFLAFAASCFAAGTVQQTTTQLGNSDSWVTTFRWVGDSIDGSVPITPAKGLGNLQGYVVTGVQVIPGTPSPTGLYSVALPDGSGIDLLGGAASNLSATVPAAFTPSGPTIPLQGTISLSITGQSVSGAKGAVYIFLIKPSAFTIAQPLTPNKALLLDSHNVASGSTTVQQGPTTCTNGGFDVGFLFCRTSSDNFSPTAARSLVTANQTFNGTSGTATGIWSNLFIPNLTGSSGASSILGYTFQGVDGVPGGAATIGIGIHGECHNNSTGTCLGFNSETAQFAAGAGTLVGFFANAGLASGRPSVGTQHTVYGAELLMSYPTGGTNPGSGVRIAAENGAHTSGLRIEECGPGDCGSDVGSFVHMADVIAYQSAENILEMSNNNASTNTGFTNEIWFGRGFNGPAATANLQAKIVSDITGSGFYGAGKLSFFTANGSNLVLGLQIDDSQGITFPALHSTTGTRFLCVNSSGQVTASSSACSGT